MFNPKNLQSNGEFNDKNISSEWLDFSSKKNRNKLLEELSIDNKFIKEDTKIRNMVINILDKEFGKNIRNINDYEFLIDSVVNKIKSDQLNSERLN